MQPESSFNTIRMSESFTHIATAMHAIQSELKPIEKKGKNEAQRYNYAKFEDFVEHVRDVLSKHGLLLITTTRSLKRLEPRATKSGSFQFGVEVEVTLRIFHITGEWMEIDCYGEGQDSGDKAIYKAITGARKYAISCLLGLSTTDDPENDENDRKPHPASNFRPSQAPATKTPTVARQSSPPPPQKRNAPPNIHASTGEILEPTPENGALSFKEIMAAMGNAKTARDIIETLDMCRGIALSNAQKKELTQLKDEMKAKVNG